MRPNSTQPQAVDGRAVVYMVDEERGEFLYRYVSNGYYAEGADPGDLLTDGTLYAARATEDRRGEWLPLTPDITGMDLAEISIHTCQAGSIVGATAMDARQSRPHGQRIFLGPVRAGRQSGLAR